MRGENAHKSTEALAFFVGPAFAAVVFIRFKDGVRELWFSPNRITSTYSSWI